LKRRRRHVQDERHQSGCDIHRFCASSDERKAGGATPSDHFGGDVACRLHLEFEETGEQVLKNKAHPRLQNRSINGRITAMKMRQLILTALLLLAAGASASLAQTNLPSVASQPAGASNSIVLERAPIPAIGDIFTYKQGAYRQAVWTYLGPNGDLLCYSVKTLQGTQNTQCKTRDDNFVENSYARPNLSFPLFVGKQWEYPWKTRYHMEASHIGHHLSGYALTRVQVTAYEPVTVGAGTFDAFKIESTTTTWGEKAAVFLATMYYSPTVGIIKRDYNSVGDENYPTETHLELLSHTRTATGGAR
jgi:hypothetical protein